VKLQYIQPDGLQYGTDLCLGSIHKQSDSTDKWRQCGGNFGSAPHMNMPRTFFVEHETDCIAPMLHGGKGIFDESNAANFNAGAQENFPVKVLRLTESVAPVS
jgi:hypothetical protein